MKLTLPAGSVEDLGAGVVRVTLPGSALSDTTPEAAAGSGDAGTATSASRGDHAHPAAGGGLLSVSRTLTSPEILAFDTPILLLPVVANRAYALVSIYVTLNAGGTPYTPGIGSINFAADPNVGSQFADAFSNFIDGSRDGFGISGGGGAVWSMGNQFGKGLYVFADVAPTDGDGTLDIVVKYFVVDRTP